MIGRCVLNEVCATGWKEQMLKMGSEYCPRGLEVGLFAFKGTWRLASAEANMWGWLQSEDKIKWPPE
uniref:Uncharacterized protein n=1 Tax=Rhizophora mucronata TaxID=61149 RepID=A0A2P2QBC7_RHIMU